MDADLSIINVSRELVRQEKRTLFTAVLSRLLQKNKSYKRKKPRSEFIPIEKNYKNHNLWSLKVRENLEHLEGLLLECVPCPLHCDSCFMPTKWGVLHYSKYWGTNNSVSLTSILNHATKITTYFVASVSGSPQALVMLPGRAQPWLWAGVSGVLGPTLSKQLLPCMAAGPRKGAFQEVKAETADPFKPTSATPQHHFRCILLLKTSHSQLRIKGEGRE